MKKIIALAVATAISAPAMADLTIGGSARYQVDNSAGGDVDTSTNRVLMSISGSSTAESGLFVSAGATLQVFGARAEADATDTDLDGDLVGRDGDLAITIGNAAANIVLGDAESAGVYTDGSADTFRSAPDAVSGRAVGRTNNNVLVNITAVEGLTAQLSTELNNSNNRVVLGYDFGAAAAKVGFDSRDGGDSGYQIDVSSSIAGVAVGVSHATLDNATDDNSTAFRASYMGFAVALETHEQNNVDVDNWMANYAVANAGGVEGFTVTVGAGDSDVAGSDVNYGVRFDYAF